MPLLPEQTAPKPINELNPVFDILGKRYVLVTQAIASIPGRELKRAVASPSNTILSPAPSISCCSGSEPRRYTITHSVTR